MDSIFTIDGVGYPGVGVESLSRSALIKDGQNAGELMSGEYERDLIGTYYHYTLVLTGLEPASCDPPCERCPGAVADDNQFAMLRTQCGKQR